MNERFYQVDCETFAKIAAFAKASLSPESAWRIDVYSAQHYKERHAECHVSERGSTVAISSDGAIMSLCRSRYEDVSFRSIELIDFAKERGANKVACYEGMAPFYERRGFEITDRLEWDIVFAPSGWRGLDKLKQVRSMIVF